MLTYATEWTTALIIAHLVVITILSLLVYRCAAGRARWLGFTLLYPWLAVTAFISAQGIIADMTSVLSPLGITLTVVTACGLALMLTWSPLKHVIATLPLPWLMGIQLYRVFGAVFLFGWLAGEVPTALGPLTAFNDVLVGLTAPLIALVFTRRRTVRLARAWNIFGLLDFAYAVTVGVLAAPHALQLLALTPDSSALGLLPLSFIALWAVPLSVFLHTASLLRLATPMTAMPVNRPPAILTPTKP